MDRKVRNNRLTQAEFFKVCTWMQQHHNRLKLQRKSAEACAVEASNALNIRVVGNNVKKAAKAIGVPMWSAPDGRGRGTSYTTRVLAKAILKIAGDLGISVDEDLHKLAAGRAVNYKPIQAGEINTYKEADADADNAYC